MSQLLLISAIMFLPGTSTAEQPLDSEKTPPPIRIGDYELYAKRIKMSTDSSTVHCGLEGDAWIRRGEFIARADFISIVIDHGEHQLLSLKGNCTVKNQEFSGIADKIELSSERKMLALNCDDHSARLTYGTGENATSVRASSILF